MTEPMALAFAIILKMYTGFWWWLPAKYPLRRHHSLFASMRCCYGGVAKLATDRCHAGDSGSLGSSEARKNSSNFVSLKLPFQSSFWYSWPRDLNRISASVLGFIPIYLIGNSLWPLAILDLPLPVVYFIAQSLAHYYSLFIRYNRGKNFSPSPSPSPKFGSGRA